MRVSMTLKSGFLPMLTLHDGLKRQDVWTDRLAGTRNRGFQVARPVRGALTSVMCVPCSG